MYFEETTFLKPNKVKNILFGLLISITACGLNHKLPKYAEIVSGNNKFAGVYEYVYPDNTADLIENQYIVLTEINGNLSGNYYGTSDEFDEAREGYRPGFFVSPMDQLQITGDTIRFELNTQNSDFMTKAIELKIKSTKEAVNAGYKNWDNRLETYPKQYAGLIKDSTIVFFKGLQYFYNKTFKKIK